MHREQIRGSLGSGGKVIQRITAENGVKVNVEDDGSCQVLYVNKEGGENAMRVIRTIVEGPEIGTIYKAKVTRLMNFGAFAEFVPGKEGLVHISQLDEHRVGKVEDVVSVGDEIWVKVTEIDDQGRINLSRKEALRQLLAQQNEQ
ncbi:MAG: S1 RNA-binding domain-containing protein [Clostridia bacterium]|nr:S1 RNA-binding domain-containing protein [Clostridia bacterium]